MIDQSKTYRTRDGREVRIYCTDGGTKFPVQGATRYSDDEWHMNNWTSEGYNFSNGESNKDLVETDPHGILPRHRELLAEALNGEFRPAISRVVIDTPIQVLDPYLRAALIALARLDGEKS